MQSAGRLFYLSVFALWATPSFCTTGSDDCAIQPNSIIGDACVSYAALDDLNKKLKPALDDLTRTTDFFSHYRLNLFHKSCPFWNDENGMCGNIGCAVETLDNEEDIPEAWRAQELGKLEGPRAQHPGKKAQRQNPKRPLKGELGESVGESCVVEYDDECDERDYCVADDEGVGSKGDYVSLIRNPERYTGYAGDGARQVWESIYRENCFQKSSFPHAANLGVSQWKPSGPAAVGFKQILDAAGRQKQLEQQRLQKPNTPFVANTGFEVDDECLEKRVFYRVMSGMHASISAHLCWDFLNQTTGEWQPNLACYNFRLHKFPDRISNVYFNYALMTRAVAKLGPYLQKSGDYTFCTGDAAEDATTRAKVLEVTEQAASVPHIFDENLMFANGEGPSLKEDFRNRFRNVSRLMDCVGCDKCRLWGKLQTSGYGTALKILFELDNDSQNVPHLKRTELVALFNTYARTSSSLRAIGRFRQLMVDKAAAELRGETFVIKPSETEELPRSTPEAVDEEMDPDLLAFIKLRASSPKSDSFRDQLGHELAQFNLACKLVIKSWAAAPKRLYQVAVSEFHRLYQFWLGYPVQPRWWKFQLPDLNNPRDEL